MADEILTPEWREGAGNERRNTAAGSPRVCPNPEDCCRELSRVWEALGIKGRNGYSASENVAREKARADRLAAEVEQLTADLESNDEETQQRISTLTREFNESYAKLAGEVERLKAAATVVLQGLRGDEKGEFWSARKWLDDSDIFHGDINGLRVLEEVLRAALAPTPKGQDS